MFYKNKLFVQAIIFQTKRFFIYSSKKGINVDTIAKFQRPIDFSFLGLLKWFNKKEKEQQAKRHNFNEVMVEHFGVEVAAAQFVLNLQGRIKIKNADEWISNLQSIPLIHRNSIEIEGIDVHSSDFMYNSFSNIQLSSLQYLDISDCVNIDDWCINHLIQFRDTLLYLDISKCPNVTERGIATIHRLKKLKRFRFSSMRNVENIGLLQVLLEESLPECYIQTDTNTSIEAKDVDKDESLLSDNSQKENKLLESIYKYSPIRFESDKDKRFDSNKDKRFVIDKDKRFDSDKNKRFDSDKDKRFNSDKDKRLDEDGKLSNTQDTVNDHSFNNSSNWVNVILNKFKVEK